MEDVSGQSTLGGAAQTVRHELTSIIAKYLTNAAPGWAAAVFVRDKFSSVILPLDRDKSGRQSSLPLPRLNAKTERRLRGEEVR